MKRNELLMRNEFNDSDMCDNLCMECIFERLTTASVRAGREYEIIN